MLRRQKIVILDSLPLAGGGKTESHGVVVREITPLLAPLLHKAVLGALDATDRGDGADVSPREVADMLLGDPELKLQLLEQCCDLGEEVRNLGGCAFLQLWEGFEEVNSPFLERLVSGLKPAGSGNQDDIKPHDSPPHGTETTGTTD